MKNLFYTHQENLIFQRQKNKKTIKCKALLEIKIWPFLSNIKDSSLMKIKNIRARESIEAVKKHCYFY